MHRPAGFRSGSLLSNRVSRVAFIPFRYFSDTARSIPPSSVATMIYIYIYLSSFSSLSLSLFYFINVSLFVFVCFNVAGNFCLSLFYFYALILFRS